MVHLYTTCIVFTTRPLARCWKPTATYSSKPFFSRMCVWGHKVTVVGFEPQWYITQHVVFTTRPLARCWKPTATYSP
jgi:hypothetical protein